MNRNKENRQINFFSTLVFLMVFLLGFAQSFPLDFESTTIAYPFTNFDAGFQQKLLIRKSPKGVYIVSTTIEGKDSTSKFIKE